MRECEVANCPGKCNNINIISFKIPREFATRKLWVNNLQLREADLVKKSRICSRHFEASMIGSRRLLPNAIPSLHVHDPLQSVPAGQSRLYIRHCCVPYCTSTCPPTRLFTVPDSKRSLWLNAIGIIGRTAKRIYVCKLHFKGHPDSLTRNAIPTLKLHLPARKENIKDFDDDTIETEEEQEVDETDPEAMVEHFDVAFDQEETACEGCVYLAKKADRFEKKLRETEAVVAERDSMICKLDARIKELTRRQRKARIRDTNVICED